MRLVWFCRRSSYDDRLTSFLSRCVHRPPSSKVAVKGTDGDADSPSPAKPRPLTVDMLATTTPSAADAVNMGSPPAPTSANKKSGHAESSEVREQIVFWADRRCCK